MSLKKKIKMYKKNYIFFSFTISVLTHIFVFYTLNIKNDKSIKEIIVLDLGTYQESYQPVIKKKQQIIEKTPPTKQEKKIVKPEIKKILKEEVIKKELIPIQKPTKKKIPEKELEKKTEISEKSPKNIPLKEKEIKTSDTINQQKLKKKQDLQNKKTIVNKEMAKFLNLISKEINIMAYKSYPKQSIRKGEQGTIISIITLNDKGNLLELDFSNKRPLRLHKATEKILKKYNFPKPPQILLDENMRLKIKIPVNFILR